jgi:hypothetical protein
MKVFPQVALADDIDLRQLGIAFLQVFMISTISAELRYLAQSIFRPEDWGV